jgi:hypothetical protein
VPDQLHELGAGLGIALERALERAGDGEGVLLLDAPHHHAEVDRLGHHGHATRRQHLLDHLGDLHREPLLHLEAAGEHLDEPGDLREAHDLAVRDVGHVHPTEERQHVVLAQAVEADVLHQDHLVVADVEQGAVQKLGGILRVALGQEAVRLGDPLGRALEAVSLRVLAELEQDRLHVLFDGVAHVPCLRPPPQTERRE